jgi:hypothetical protein
MDAADLIKKAAAGMLSWRDISAPFFDHRIAIPRLATLLLWKMGGHLRNLPAMYLDWALLCAIALALMAGFHKPARAGKALSLRYAIPVMLWLFSPFQFFFFQGGLAGGGSYTSLQWTFALFGSAAALVFLKSSADLDGSFFLSASAACIATFSNASGLMVWPAGLGAKILASEPSEGRQRLIFFWCLLGAAAWGLYFRGLSPSAGPAYALLHPLLAGKFFLSYWGIPFLFGYLPLGLLVMLGTTAILMQALRKNIMRDSPLGFYLWLFVLLVCMETAAGRLATAPDGAGSRASDFYLVPTLGLIGLYYLALAAFPGRSRIRAAIAAGFALLSLSSYRTAVHEWKTVKFTYQTSAYALRNYRILSDLGLKKAWLGPQTVRQIAPFLEANKLSLFSSSAPKPLPGLRALGRGTSCAVDEINGKPPLSSILVVSPKEGMELKGWALDDLSRRAAADVYLVIDGQLEVSVSYGERRRDIARKFGAPEAAYCGWLASFVPETLGLKPGRHVLSLKTIAADGSGYYFNENIAAFLL